MINDNSASSASATGEMDLLSTAEAAQILGASIPTLERWRRIGEGPQFAQLGRLVRYRRGDLEAFVTANVRRPHRSAGA